MTEPARVIQVGRARVLIFEEKAALYAAAAEKFFHTVQESLAESGRCDVALSGGSTPKALYSLIAERIQREDRFSGLDWSRVHFWFGDERCVPPEHRDSNYAMVRNSLLRNGVIPSANVHRVAAEKPAADAAEEYERSLRQELGDRANLDLVFLGMGPDGHTASLFPDTTALNETQRLVVANHVDKLGADRITFTYRVINAARSVLFLAAGDDKQQALKSVLLDRNLPSSRVQPAGELFWYVDVAAAALLPA